MTIKLYIFLFLLLFYFVTFIVRSYILWKNTGHKAFVFKASDDAYGFNGQVFKFIAVFEIIIIAIYSFGENYYDYLLPFWYLENNYLQFIGWVLLHGSLIWVFTAQLQMADSWRIGIDFGNKTPLVTKGLFSFSRNPIFLGILTANLGLFLVLPNAFTLLIVVWSYTVIQTQVRLEEEFLKKVHGDEYEKYFKQVRRWA